MGFTRESKLQIFILRKILLCINCGVVADSKAVTNKKAKTFLVVLSNNKLQSLCSPTKISAGCDPGCNKMT